MHLPKPTMWVVLIAGGLYVGGAVAVEAVNNKLFNYHSGVKTLGYELLVALEEGLEMFGVILFIYSFMVYMAKQDIRVELAIRGFTVQPPQPQKMSVEGAQHDAASKMHVRAPSPLNGS